MKILLITVAGTASRFSTSIGYECLKCIYYKDSITTSLLYRILHQDVKFDKYIIVGGFMFEALKDIINRCFSDLSSDITLIENQMYREYGSGYSLYLGLQEAVKSDFDELVFAEGDLYVDKGSFQKVYSANKNVITCIKENIDACKSVAFYFDLDRRIHYIYDTQHQAFFIKEPFTSIFNSGQIWKFSERNRLTDIILRMDETEMHGTNLVIIQKYFTGLPEDNYTLIQLDKWVNCNTIQDFEKISELDNKQQ